MLSSQVVLSVLVVCGIVVHAADAQILSGGVYGHGLLGLVFSDMVLQEEFMLQDLLLLLLLKLSLMLAL